MLRYPVDYVGITKHYSILHRGIDLGWETTPNVPILAADDGIVASCGMDSSKALYVVLRHEISNGYYYTLYWHLSRISVARGQEVKQGESIGVMGQTGKATGVHLHYEVWQTPRTYSVWNLKDKAKYALDPKKVTYLFEGQRQSAKTKNLLAPPTGELTLQNEPLYVSSTAKKMAGRVSGVYYRWDESVVNGRIRITNQKERVGVSGQVTGWIKSR